MDLAISKLLVQAKFLKEVRKKTSDKKHFLEIELLKSDKGGYAIRGVKIVSRPGRRIYRGYLRLRPVKQGYGIAVLSTSKGIMTDAQARKARVGGEYLFELW